MGAHAGHLVCEDCDSLLYMQASVSLQVSGGMVKQKVQAAVSGMHTSPPGGHLLYVVYLQRPSHVHHTQPVECGEHVNRGVAGKQHICKDDRPAGWYACH